ncbi:IS1 family transposase [Spirosoma daeguense]
MERSNNTLQQRCSWLVRKTLSFSKSVENYYQTTLSFLRHYNFEILAKNPSFQLDHYPLR